MSERVEYATAARTAPPARPARLVESRMLDVGVPVAIRVLESLLQLLAVAVLARGTGNSVSTRFTIWDGQLYGQIVRYGYPGSLQVSHGALVSGNNLAFSPGYPGLSWLVWRLTPLSVGAAQIVVAWVAACAFSVCVHLLAKQLAGRRAGYLAAVFVGLLPMAVVFQMAYAESLFAALSAGALLAATRRRWWLAGGLAFLAGATRPIGYVTAAGLAVLAWQQGAAQRTAERRAAITSCALAVAGTVGYWVVVGLVTGKATAWFQIERLGWGTHLDFGHSAFTFVRSTLAAPATHSDLEVGIALILVGALVTVLVAGRSRPDWPYGAVALLAFASVIASTNFWHSRPRLLLAGAVIVVPLARRAARLPLAVVVPVALAGFAISAWFGAYMLTRWKYAI